jgi:hypothetical protein
MILAADPGRQHRDVALLFPDEPLYCPRGHRVPKHFWLTGADQSGGYRCQFHEPPGKHACGAVVLLLQFIPGIRIVVDVSSAELHHMESPRMTLSEIRDFLGLTWSSAA